MSSDMRWKVFVKDMESKVRIGIHDHEQAAQRIIVNAEIEGVYPHNPSSIDDCFNYDCIYRLVVQSWPNNPHVQLLETLATELLNHIFTTDARVQSASVSVAKTDIFKEAAQVGVEAVWTRADYQKFKQ